MASQIATADSPPEIDDWQKRRVLPAWLLSLVIHFTLFTVLSLTMQGNPQGTQQGEPTRSGGIALAQTNFSGQSEYQFADDSRPAGEGTSPAATDASAASSPFPEAAAAPTGEGPQLPTGNGGLAGANLPGELLPAASAAGGGGGKTGGTGIGKGAQTQVFGVKGEGSRFVYVFDRSSSMSGFEGRPLAAAKRELVASLQNLGKVHQFQIIFYNQDPYVMNPFGTQTPNMLFADDQGKAVASKFISGVTADGATEHVAALKMALRMRPDVIFFLTDADEPQMTLTELKTIQSLNHGTSINAIEFGAGPVSTARYNFLQRLAAENHGNYGYVDVTRLSR